MTLFYYSYLLSSNFKKKYLSKFSNKILQTQVFLCHFANHTLNIETKYNFQYIFAVAKLTLPKLNALSIRGSYYYLDLVIELSCSLSSRSFVIGRQVITRLPLTADWPSLARLSTSKPLLLVLRTPLIYFSPLCFLRICRVTVG